MTELVLPTEADAGTIAAVINARSRALRGVSEETAERVARWFALPDIDTQADMRLAVGADGAAEGYADVSGPEDGTRKAWVDLRSTPGHPSAVELLFAWAEARALDRVGSGGVIQYFVDEGDKPMQDRLGEAGYRVVRHSYEMGRPLDGDLERPVLPKGVVTRSFDACDAPLVHAAHVEAFSDHWGYTPASYETWRALNLAAGEGTSLWRIAWEGDVVVALCICHPRRGEDESVGWVDVLGVRQPWRRQGVGEALLRESFRLFAAAGKRSAGLSVDAENTTGAVALYERVGMHVVWRSDTWERTA